MKYSSPTNISSRLDYDPFGMMMVGRSWSGGSEYRYGFNGKEQDAETYGEGSIYDYGFRIYNPRLGKFLSIDPLTSDYPMLTPYQFASNTPIQAIDLDGLEAWLVNNEWTREDIFKFGAFAQTELEKITALGVEGLKYDCADLALHLIIRYAAENGLPLEFTGTNKKVYNPSVLSNPVGDVDAFEKRVSTWTSAKSLRDNEMTAISGNPVVGDMTNSGGHINIVRRDNPEDIVPPGEIPSVSGTLPEVYITEKRYTWVGPENQFYRWDDLVNAPMATIPSKVEFIGIKQIQLETFEPEIKEPINSNNE